MIRLALAAALWAALPLRAHDLITSEAVDRYLAQAAAWQAVIQSQQPAPQRAEAHFRVGTMLEEIRELLNADLSAHGRVQGLPSSILVSELRKIGTPLAWSEAQRRFGFNTGHFRQALALGLGGAQADQSRLRLLQGGFYDSFETDPLESAQTWAELETQMALAERLTHADLVPEAREEVAFIMVILQVRAARRAPVAATSRAYREKALAAANAFKARYSRSLRAAAMEVLLEALR
jgi:hypothetical protein